MANSVFDPCPTASRTASFLLPAVPAAVREGRRRVRTTLLGWGLGLDEDSSWSLTVVCGELLVRAVRRAAGGPAGRLAVGVDVEGDQVIVDVLELLDGAPPSARVRAEPHGPHGEDGWALALVGAHCTAHGTEHTPAGPRCWAVVTLPAGAFPGRPSDVERLGSTRWVVEPAGAALARAGTRVLRMGQENVPFA
ncbi:ATP-binding protein [Streptomyces violaceoruber]|uniref:ATP-binding protein n=2 Tax=Streptomyces TaxID=1883 RepID=A0ABM5RA24_STRLI|nr:MULTISPECIES: ATP-binding protein [Streptomyces]QSJ12695.1 hypothetical protein SLIVDG2_31025 [Streptomyces lividans]AIJ17093.1 hypothetical protein SLIV_31025 [Streptomyces lividans TK24]MDX3366562.1 ATP-binding protein [Streptomyces sp. ME02-6987-2C]MDX3420834.1 ATP-binding protein [Streptomyces sp. ME02-6985-2c]QTD73605.1 hypothetical protein SLIVYQS_31025 [Streptomyces lividans TK24] [Streptomyces lividans]